MRTVNILSFLIVLLGCAKEAVTQSTEFEANKEKWESTEIEDYSFVLRIMCFCAPETTEPKTIVVKGGEITTVNGKPYDPEQNWGVVTISDLFDKIENITPQNPAVLNVTYDTKYGFPSSLYIDRDEMIADEEIGYSVSDFSPL